MILFVEKGKLVFWHFSENSLEDWFLEFYPGQVRVCFFITPVTLPAGSISGFHHEPHAFSLCLLPHLSALAFSDRCRRHWGTKFPIHTINVHVQGRLQSRSSHSGTTANVGGSPAAPTWIKLLIENTWHSGVLLCELDQSLKVSFHFAHLF